MFLLPSILRAFYRFYILIIPLKREADRRSLMTTDDDDEGDDITGRHSRTSRSSVRGRKHGSANIQSRRFLRRSIS